MIVIIHTILQFTQIFVGGALSSLAGMNLGNMKGAKHLGEMTGLGKQKIVNGKKVGHKYLFKSKTIDKGLFYGLQSLGSDFAYMDKKKFGKQEWYNHFFSFSIGAFNGFVHADKNLTFGHSLLGYAGFDYGLKIINQGYDPYMYKYRDQKVGIFSLKTIPLLFR